MHCLKSVQIRSFSGLYFPAFGLNTVIYSVNFRIQSECGKMRTRKNSVLGHFSCSIRLKFCLGRNMSIHRIGVRGDTNTKTSEAFLKRGESIENEKLLLNLSDIKVFFRIEGILSKTFVKRTISIVGIRLLFHFLGGCIRQITRQI